MQFSVWNQVVVLAASLSVANAQTWSACNPLLRTCPANPALGPNLNTNFVGASALPAGWAMSNGVLGFDANGAKFTVGRQGESPTVGTTGYFLFGYVEVKMRAAAGQGIISSIVLESDDLDEVDWEFTGTDTTRVQSNYFGKADVSTYDRGGFHPVTAPQQTVHSYAINWTPTVLQWIIDGTVIRTLNYNDAKGGTRFPQTPMRLKLGIWAGGDPSNSPGTIEWAGGRTDYSQAPFNMWVQSASIVNYSPATSYTYSDNSGAWQSIRATGGTVMSNGGAGGSAAPAPAAAAPAPASASAAPVPSPVRASSTFSSSTRTSILTSTAGPSSATKASSSVSIASSLSTVIQIASFSNSTTSLTPTSTPSLFPTSVRMIAVSTSAAISTVRPVAATGSTTSKDHPFSGVATCLLLLLSGLVAISS